MSIVSKLHRAASTCTSIKSSISSSIVPVFGGGRMTAATTVSSSINNDHVRHEIMMRSPQMHQLESSNNIPSNRSTVLVTPPPKQLLMLEGDEMYISPNGKSHTVYKLENQNVSSSSHRVNGDRRSKQITLEEVYDIELAKKSISLHIDSTTSCHGVFNRGMTSNDQQHRIREREENCFTFDIQEINNGVLNGSGTGSMSWDSSIGKYLMISIHSRPCSSDISSVYIFLILSIFFFCLHLHDHAKK